MMDLRRRAELFRLAYPRRPASWPWVVTEQGGDVLYAMWVLGANYRNRTRYYGAYPADYLPRVSALFPDALGPGVAARVLHAFAGSVPAGPWVRCDVQGEAEERCSVLDLPPRYRSGFALVLADPPYTRADATRYGTAMVDRRRCTAALAEVTEPGGHMVWLDTVWPMHSRRQWRTAGRICVVRSTNHRVRTATIFERQ